MPAIDVTGRCGLSAAALRRRKCANLPVGLAVESTNKLEIPAKLRVNRP
jgi:hypothetical protein